MLGKLIPGLIGLMLGVALVLWFQVGARTDFDEKMFQARVPGSDYKGVGAGPTAGKVSANVDTWPLKLVKGDAQPSKLPGYWPHFRGPNLDAIVSNLDFELNTDWSKQGPREIWKLTVGEGHAGVAVRDGKCYLMDYDSNERRDVMRCLSLADGKEIWSNSYPIKIKRSHGITRTIPAVTEKYVIGIGPKCHTTCLDLNTGELKWKIDMVGTYGTKIPTWYTGQCPLVMGDQVILAPSGPEVLMLAVKIDTGEVIWKAKNPQDWKMTHTCILPMKFEGKDLYLYSASGGVYGVSATDGKIIFEIPEWKIKIAAVATPVPIGDGRVFLSGGYGIGSMMIRLTSEGDKIVPKILYRLKPKVFGSAQHTPLLYKNHLYGVRPDQQLVCLDLDGKEVWTSTSSHKFGIGPYMIIGDKIFVMNDSGLLSVVEATHEHFKLVTEKKILDGHDSWGLMTLAGDRLILRDLTQMVCLDLRKK